MNPQVISLKSLIKRFWKRISVTWILVLAEGMALLITPLVIGWAVDDLMNQSYAGVYQLGALAVFMLVSGAGRRFYDTRIYARIFRTVAKELVEREQQKGSGLSKVSARTHLFYEFIEFLEDSVPEIVNQIINTVGTLIIILMIDPMVFLGCLVCVIITALVYACSNQRIYKYNKGGNDEMERQVDILGSRNPFKISCHFSRLMRWQIKLSDLETINFSLIWLALAANLIFTVVIVTSGGGLSFGQIVSTVMYVFGFIESLLIFPLFYQELVRLAEIAVRLNSPIESEPETIDVQQAV